MAGPAYTPITSNPFVDVSSTAEATFNSPTARSYGLGLVQRFREEHLSSLRPMSEFFDRNRVSFPSGFSDA
ncbi:hypothetical protein BGW38_002180 [Lunasporangiospora selenospora]|uniref:Uncharacterized protein n=1 Tax=Lunasporangiospora selenospora TaxID=979761 RepID=A0A9P6FUI5_9FUNG|nr:hypothetical protein BGW38_002180 [Lunasporangiospora selenospora]